MFNDFDLSKVATSQAVNRARAEGFLVGALAGAGIAAIATLLFAPKSGKELREDISQQTSDLAHQASEKTSEYYDSAVDQFSKAKDNVESGIESVTDNFGQSN